MSESDAADQRSDHAGATLLDADAAEQLLPSHITTHGALNEWEQANIAEAQAWALANRRRAATKVLTVAFAVELHRRMFDKTWAWAGQYRQSDKKIGVPWSQVRSALSDRLADALLWHREKIFAPDERAARFHYQLVLVHPWPNGNGRWARLMADAMLSAERLPLLSWGRGVNAAEVREAYLGALRAADRGDFAPLLVFVRS